MSDMRVTISHSRDGFALEVFRPSWRRAFMLPVWALCAATGHRIEFTDWYQALVRWVDPRTDVVSVPVSAEVASLVSPGFADLMAQLHDEEDGDG